MKALAVADRLTRWASGALLIAAGVAMALMMLHVVLDVSFRFLFNAPVQGTGETVTIYYMVMVTVLPFAYVARGEGHIVVELFTQGLSQRHRLALEAAVGVLTLAFMVALTWKSGEEAWAMTAIGEVREAGDSTIVAWPARWLLPLGAGVMAVAVALRILEDARAALRR